MTTKEGKLLLAPFIEKAERDGDPYLTVHFSKDSDYVDGSHDGMDEMDVMIVIKFLVKHFKINPVLLNTATAC